MSRQDEEVADLDKRIKKLERDNWFKQHLEPKESCNVAIIGLGHQGDAFVHELENLRSIIDYPQIGTVYLVTSDMRKKEVLERDVGVIHDKTSRDFRNYSREEFKEHVNECDICVITSADPNLPVEKDRYKYAAPNAPIIKEIASVFHKDYNGNVIVVTNPTDVMTYLFAQYSGMDPRLIIGLNYLDTKRMRDIIRDRLVKTHKHELTDKQLEGIVIENAYAVGDHQEPRPCLRRVKATIPGLGLKGPKGLSEDEIGKIALSYQNFVTSFIEQVVEIKGAEIERIMKDKGTELDDKTKLVVGKHAEDQVKKGATASQTAKAAVDTIKAIVKQQKGELTASALFDADGQPIYIGLPVDVEPDQYGVHFEIKPGFIDELKEHPADYEKFQERVKKVKTEINKLRDAGLIDKPPLIIPEKLRPPRIVKKKEEQLIVGAGGSANKVFAWDNFGYQIFEMPVSIGKEKKFASCVKAFKYGGDDYLAIGTSSGILIKSLCDPRFSSELLITDPSGEIGHFRSIEVFGKYIIGSNYHLFFTDSQFRTGKGIFLASLDEILKKPKNDFGQIVQSAVGPISICAHEEEEFVLFIKEADLWKYTPDIKRTQKLQSLDNPITAISRDGLVVGDSRGMIYLFDDHSYKNSIAFNAKPSQASITAIEHVVEQGNHLFLGDRRGYFNYFEITSEGPVKKVAERVGRVNPIGRESPGDEIMPVSDIKYVKIDEPGSDSGLKMIFLTCGADISCIRLNDLLAKKAGAFTKPWNKDQQRSIFSIDFYKGECKFGGDSK
jgi:malate/lactate dehydrogenase